MIRKYVLSFIFAYILILLFSASSYALEKGTHANINEYIARNSYNGFSLNLYLINHLGIQGGVEATLESNKINKTISKWLGYGGEMEDASLRRSANHFHNPLTDAGFSGIWGTGFYSGESSIVWSQLPVGEQVPKGHYSWHDVRNYFYNALTATDKDTKETNFADTFRGLGQLMHLVQDLSVPDIYISYRI